MKEKIKFVISIVTIFIIAVSVGYGLHVLLYSALHKCNEIAEHNYEVYRSRIELAMEGVKDEIVTEIDMYIDSVAPNSALHGLVLFEACDKYNVDVMFAITQAQAESNFGTAGMAAKTNSVWNVKAFDGRTLNDIKRNNGHFRHPDESIEPYLKLLTNDYLVNDKTEEDMFIKFVNKDGKRYASNEKYEALMLNIYTRISEETNLKDLLKEYKKYKLILGV